MGEVESTLFRETFVVFHIRFHRIRDYHDEVSMSVHQVCSRRVMGLRTDEQLVVIYTRSTDLFQLGIGSQFSSGKDVHSQ